MRRIASYAAALLVGLTLAAAPWLWFRDAGHGGAAHGNHEARHGGQLGMVGDHHLELVRRGTTIEVFVSDAERRPVAVERGRLVFDRAREAPLTWDRYRLVGPDDPNARDVTAIVEIRPGVELSLTFDVTP